MPETEPVMVRTAKYGMEFVRLISVLNQWL
jgi:hypothetical protein